MRTYRIRSLDGLMLAVRRKRSVIVSGAWSARIPAAFVIGMPAYLVHRYISGGMFVYYPSTKARKP